MKRITRKSFINYLLGISSVSALGSILYPVFRYLIPPESAEAVPASITVMNEEDLKPNSSKIFRFGKEPAILVKTSEGDIKAFTATCTHLGCIVQYRPDMEHIWCACHNGHYNLRGVNIAGPPPRPLTEFSVGIRDGKIIVSKTS